MSVYQNVQVQHRLSLSSLDAVVLGWLRRHSLTLLRLAIGAVYVWFGALKLVPGLSPAEPLIRGAYDFLPEVLMQPYVAFIGAFEVVIGLLFVYGKLPRLTIVLMLMQMAGAMSPMVLAPELVWTAFPYAYTLEGQYIFKDIILVAAGLVVFASNPRQPASAS